MTGAGAGGAGTGTRQGTTADAGTGPRTATRARGVFVDLNTRPRALAYINLEQEPDIRRSN
eukprot:2470051-Lingulodinium_polyedra.AAC.1